VSKLEPLVAAPHSPDNRKLARECSDVKIDRVYIGSCTGAPRRAASPANTGRVRRDAAFLLGPRAP
jgi:homoaconitase/3-isopropylmalate dehydratase large subunit